MSEKLQEKLTNFTRHSKGGITIDQNHWMGRARACIYYRRTNKYGDDPALRAWTQTAILDFDWETAQTLATS